MITMLRWLHNEMKWNYYYYCQLVQINKSSKRLTKIHIKLTAGHKIGGHKFMPRCDLAPNTSKMSYRTQDTIPVFWDTHKLSFFYRHHTFFPKPVSDPTLSQKYRFEDTMVRKILYTYLINLYLHVLCLLSSNLLNAQQLYLFYLFYHCPNRREQCMSFSIVPLYRLQ